MSLLLRIVSDWNPADPMAAVTLPLKPEVEQVFAAYPEWYIEDMMDFLLFAMQYAPTIVENYCTNEVIVFLIVFMCSANYVSNPYLISKIVEVMFGSSPTMNPNTEGFYRKLLSHPLAQTHLARALMKFYTDVESTGASSEFYDKFTIRYHISVVLKTMWADRLHQMAIVEESRDGNQFVKFINMLMNDTTFLLDERYASAFHRANAYVFTLAVWSR